MTKHQRPGRSAERKIASDRIEASSLLGSVSQIFRPTLGGQPGLYNFLLDIRRQLESDPSFRYSIDGEGDLLRLTPRDPLSRHICVLDISYESITAAARRYVSGYVAASEDTFARYDRRLRRVIEEQQANLPFHPVWRAGLPYFRRDDSEELVHPETEADLLEFRAHRDMSFAGEGAFSSHHARTLIGKERSGSLFANTSDIDAAELIRSTDWDVTRISSLWDAISTSVLGIGEDEPPLLSIAGLPATRFIGMPIGARDDANDPLFYQPIASIFVAADEEASAHDLGMLLRQIALSILKSNTLAIAQRQSNLQTGAAWAHEIKHVARALGQSWAVQVDRILDVEIVDDGRALPTLSALEEIPEGTSVSALTEKPPNIGRLQLYKEYAALRPNLSVTPFVDVLALSGKMIGDWAATGSRDEAPNVPDQRFTTFLSKCVGEALEATIPMAMSTESSSGIEGIAAGRAYIDAMRLFIRRVLETCVIDCDTAVDDMLNQWRYPFLDPQRPDAIATTLDVFWDSKHYPLYTRGLVALIRNAVQHGDLTSPLHLSARIIAPADSAAVRSWAGQFDRILSVSVQNRLFSGKNEEAALTRLLADGVTARQEPARIAMGLEKFRDMQSSMSRVLSANSHSTADGFFSRSQARRVQSGLIDEDGPSYRVVVEYGIAAL